MSSPTKSEVQSIQEDNDIEIDTNLTKNNGRSSITKNKTSFYMIFIRFIKEFQKTKQKRQFKNDFQNLSRLVYSFEEYNFQVDLLIFKKFTYVNRKLLIHYQQKLRKQSNQSKPSSMENVNELMELQNMMINFYFFYLKVYLDKCHIQETKTQIVSQCGLDWSHLEKDSYFTRNQNLLAIFHPIIRYKLNQQSLQNDIENGRYYDQKGTQKLQQIANCFFKEYITKNQNEQQFKIELEQELENFVMMFLEQMLINGHIVKRNNMKLGFYYFNNMYMMARKLEYQGNLRIISKCIKIRLAYAAFFIELKQYKDAIRILLKTLQLQQYEFQKISYEFNKNDAVFQKILVQKIRKIVATTTNLIICYVKTQEFQKLFELINLQQFLVENFIPSKDDISKFHRKMYDYTIGLKNLGSTILIIAELGAITEQSLSHDDYLEILGQKIQQKKKEIQNMEQTRFDNKHQMNSDCLKNLSNNIYIIDKQQSNNQQSPSFHKNDQSQYGQTKYQKQQNSKDNVLVGNDVNQQIHAKPVSSEEFKREQSQKENTDINSYVSLDKLKKQSYSSSRVDRSTAFKTQNNKSSTHQNRFPKNSNECDFDEKDQEYEKGFDTIFDNKQEDSFDFDQEFGGTQKSSLLSIKDIRKQIDQKRKIRNYKLSRREFQVNQQNDYKPKLIANPWFFDDFVENEENKLNKYDYNDIHMSVSQRRLIKLQAQQQQLQQIKKLKNLSEEERKEVQQKQQQQQFRQQQLKKFNFNEGERSFQGLDQQMKQFISEQEKVYQYVDLDEVDQKYDEIVDEQYKNSKEFNYCKKIVKFKSKEGIKTNPKVVYQLPHKRHNVVTDQIIRKNMLQKQLNDQLISKGIKDGENVQKNENMMRIDANSKQQKRSKSMKEIVMKNQDVFNSYNFTLQYKNQSEEFKRKQNSWILKTHILKNSLSPAKINQLSQQRRMEIKEQSFTISSKINAIIFEKLKIDMLKRDQKKVDPDSSRLFNKELTETHFELSLTSTNKH